VLFCNSILTCGLQIYTIINNYYGVSSLKSCVLSMHQHTHTHMHTRTCTHMHTHAHTHMHTHTFTHMHPHAPTHSSHVYIHTHHAGKFVSIQGTVVRVGNVKPLVTKMAFKCSLCHGTQVLALPDGKYTLPTKVGWCISSPSFHAFSN